MFGFAIAKLFAFLPFGNILGGTLGKLLLIVVLIVGAFLGWKLWLHQHDKAVRQEALLEWNRQQQDLAEKQRLEFERQMELLSEDSEEQLERLRADRDYWARRSSELANRIRAGEFNGSENESSEVLKETIRALQERAREAAQ